MRWSNSSLALAQQCGEKFRRRYLENDRRPSGPNAKRGTAVHKVAATSHMRQFASREAGRSRREYINNVPSVEEASDLAATAFDAAVKLDGVAFSEEDKETGEAKVLGAAKDAAVKMSKHYVSLIAPKIDPRGVERRVTIKPAGVDFEILGIVDLVSEEAAPKDPFDPDAVEQQRIVRIEPPKMIEVINDLKTKARSPSPDEVERSQQLAIYTLIRAAEVGKIPEKVRLRTLVVTRTGKVSHVEQTGTKTAADLEATVQRLNTAITMVEKGVFMPANPDSWWCSAKYCEYYSDCKFALGKR